MKNTLERLNEILKHTGQTLNSFSKEIGLKRSQNLYDIRDGRVKNISLGLAAMITERFPEIDKEWLLTGKGEMLHHGNKLHSPIIKGQADQWFPGGQLEEKKEIENNFVGVPMYNIPASASLVEMYGDASDVKIVGHLTIPGATKDSFALPVHGHSMYPTLENGSWCVLRPLNDKTDIEWGEIYYIEYGDYRMYKRLLKADDEDSVILWSDNQSEIINNRPKYSAKTIKKEKIRRLCLLTDILKKPNY